LLKSLNTGKFKVEILVKNSKTKKTILDCNRILFGNVPGKHSTYQTEFQFLNEEMNDSLARGTLELIFHDKSKFWNTASYFFKVELVEKQIIEMQEEIKEIEEYTVQLYVGDEKRNRILRVDESFDSLLNRLTNEFGSRIIKYKDQEDEMVSIHSNEDLKLFFKFLSKNEIIPKLYFEEPINSKRKDSIKNWQKGKIIGSGGFAKVYEGLNQDDGTLFALKEIKLDNINEKNEKYKALESEIKLLATLDHPNIVRYLGFEKNEKIFCFFLEFMSGGSLESKCHSYLLQENVVRNYTFQILMGLNYLHSKNILHRDIKPGTNQFSNHKEMYY
jgi:hypothetical protein